MNSTAEKFGYPDSLLKSFGSWHVLMRPAQPTLGSLILVCSEPARSFGAISPEAGARLAEATGEIERVLGEALQFDKINYLMLMMVDPDVHFHVLPRYSEAREYAGLRFVDDSWPGPPDVTATNDFPDTVKTRLIQDLKARFS